MRPGSWRSAAVQCAWAAGALALLALVVVRQPAAVVQGLRTLSTASTPWLGLAGAAVVLLWVSGTLTQLGALPLSPPVVRLFAVQVAGSFANHVSPAGAGGFAVNFRFLRRQGLTRESAAASQVLGSAAGVTAHLALLVTVAVAAPRVEQHAALVPLRSLLREPTGWVVPAGAVLLLLLGLLGVMTGARGGWVATRTRAAAAGARRTLLAQAAILRDPRRAVLLWGGAVTGPLLHALVLFAVLRALDHPLPLVTVTLAYSAGSAISALVPSPGGLGALDVTLPAALVAVGLPASVAVDALLGYRFMTVWVPLPPGAATLAVLSSRRII
ncbi:uncharacterized membrane protein YbhN (UPF0104 family) [Motilibacter peucedani]|uniref:Uncharacterized membrane protein YbhN (UPF0104 family) n=1 Tax=Motilibacter peucedani TaxID=598650 RepID=A0A420XT83_9ACTN|nr:lysylphosphatidylglycerol synthase transmembrane domain-containing protein [Motilibacter peucedani]RKS80062.1 uncharacterized membrane protein YbhN (UPF0104 family) [Motilibacter peucedani]